MLYVWTIRRLFFIFSKFPLVLPLGGYPPPIIPRIFSHLNIVRSLWNLVHMFYVWLPRRLFSFFSKISPIPLPGGNPPQNPPSRNNVRLPWNLVYMLCTTLLNECLFKFSKILPHFPPPRAGGLSALNSKISKFSPIDLKLVMSVLWHITRGWVLSVFRNAPQFPPFGGRGPTPKFIIYKYC